MLIILTVCLVLLYAICRVEYLYGTCGVVGHLYARRHSMQGTRMLQGSKAPARYQLAIQGAVHHP